MYRNCEIEKTKVTIHSCNGICSRNFERGWQLCSNVLCNDLLSVMDWFISWACIFHSRIQGSEGHSGAFMEMVCRMLPGPSRNKDYIINMDQSPIPFTFNRQRTWELVGTCPAQVCKLTCDTEWATLVVTITALGKMITPILVFKVCWKAILQHGISPHIHVIYLCMSDICMDWWGSHVAVGRAVIEASHSGGSHACCSNFSRRFLQVPHDCFGCNADQWVRFQSAAYSRWNGLCQPLNLE